MRKFPLIIICFLALSCMQGKKTTTTKAGAQLVPGQAAPPKVSISDKIKSCKKTDGLFPLYQDTATGNVYMIIKKAQLDKDYIYFSYTVDGIVAAGHFRGSF